MLLAKTGLLLDPYFSSNGYAYVILVCRRPFGHHCGISLVIEYDGADTEHSMETETGKQLLRVRVNDELTLDAGWWQERQAADGSWQRYVHMRMGRRPENGTQSRYTLQT